MIKQKKKMIQEKIKKEQTKKDNTSQDRKEVRKQEEENRTERCCYCIVPCTTDGERDECEDLHLNGGDESADTEDQSKRVCYAKGGTNTASIHDVT